MTVLLREAIGDRLRHARTNQRRTLREISHTARVSLGYLSEVERGQKEASSELLSAICDALDLPLSELLVNVASDVSALETMNIAAPDAPRSAGNAGEITNSVGRTSTALKSTISSPKVGVFTLQILGVDPEMTLAYLEARART